MIHHDFDEELLVVVPKRFTAQGFVAVLVSCLLQVVPRTASGVKTGVKFICVVITGNLILIWSLILVILMHTMCFQLDHCSADSVLPTDHTSTHSELPIGFLPLGPQAGGVLSSPACLCPSVCPSVRLSVRP